MHVPSQPVDVFRVEHLAVAAQLIVRVQLDGIDERPARNAKGHSGPVHVKRRYGPLARL